MLLFVILACSGPKSVDIPDDTATDTGDSAPDSTDTRDSADSGDTADTEDTGDTTDSTETDTGEPPPDSLGALTLTVDPDVVTVLHAAFTDPEGHEAWVEYRFEDEAWLVAPTVGPGDAVLLGIPAETPVEARAAARWGDVTVYSEVATATTGPLPADLLLPNVVLWDPTRAYDADWVMVSVDHAAYTYSPPWWIEIFDRQGRIVWYLEVPDDHMSFYPTVAFDGTHIWWDGANFFGMSDTPGRVVRQTLDGRWRVDQTLPGAPGEAVAEGPDGSFFYEDRGGVGYGLSQLEPDGTTRRIWDCGAFMAELGVDSRECWLNTCNWSEEHGTILASSFTSDTVYEVDVATGEVVRQMGQLEVGDPWSFDPPDRVFEYQHDAMWLDNGNLLASTHVRNDYGVQVAAEYEVDDDTQTLRVVWEYVSEDRFATQVGEALRLPNGNSVQGYGQDGAIREVTPDGEAVWEVDWAKDSYGYRAIGHASFIPDLYALNRGPAD